MKINCTNCGKKFDPDKYMYICPNCNQYNEKISNYLQRKLTPEEQAEYDAKYNREPMSYDRYPKDVMGPERLLPRWFRKTKFYKDRPYLAYVIPSIGVVAILIFVIIYGIENV